MTNMEAYTPTSDAIQLRPFEVLVDVWAQLRLEVRQRSIAIDALSRGHGHHVMLKCMDCFWDMNSMLFY